MRFFCRLVAGLPATGVNFIILYAVVRWLVRGNPSPARYVAPLSQVVRYGIFGVIVYLALRYQVGSPGGLLAGVTVGIVGFMVWQLAYNARNRRSS